MTRLAVRTLPAALLVAALVVPAAGAAQELSGLAVGPDGEALGEIPVVLHRVGGGGGAFIDTDTTTTDGRFRFLLAARDSAVYFAAIRYEGRLYIGPAVQAGLETDPVTGYIVRVDPANEAGAIASALGPPTGPAQPGPARGAGSSGAPDDAGALALVGVLALVAAAAFFFAAPRYRSRRTRDALIELATLENALAEAEPGAERDRLESERAQLRGRLTHGG